MFVPDFFISRIPAPTTSRELLNMPAPQTKHHDNRLRLNRSIKPRQASTPSNIRNLLRVRYPSPKISRIRDLRQSGGQTQCKNHPKQRLGVILLRTRKGLSAGRGLGGTGARRALWFGYSHRPAERQLLLSTRDNLSRANPTRRVPKRWDACTAPKIARSARRGRAYRVATS